MPALTRFFFCLFLLNCQCRLHDFACERGDGGKRTDFKGFIYVHTHAPIYCLDRCISQHSFTAHFLCLFFFGFFVLFCFIFLFLAVFHPPPQCHFK